MIGTPRPSRPAPRQACAGAVIHDEAGRMLLVLRANEPSAGRWSVPGGRCRAGESAAEACVREVAEETGLTVVIARRAGRVEREGPDGSVYVIDDYVCRVVAGELRAGDDAAEARWVDRAEFERLDLAAGVAEALADWGLLPGQPRGIGCGRAGCSPPRASM